MKRLFWLLLLVAFLVGCGPSQSREIWLACVLSSQQAYTLKYTGFTWEVKRIPIADQFCETEVSR